MGELTPEAAAGLAVDVAVDALHLLLGDLGPGWTAAARPTPGRIRELAEEYVLACAPTPPEGGLPPWWRATVADATARVVDAATAVLR